MAESDRQPSVYVHVGAPKTGTTFLQEVLWKNRKALADSGVCYPLRRPGEHFAATMDLRQMSWAGERKPEWEGAWERLAARVRAWDGPTAVISNELLGGASVEQVTTAVESLAPAQVHVVFTARDLARQLPSDWQEQVKHRREMTLEEFVTDCVEEGSHGRFGEAFWRLHDVLAVLGRWGAQLPAAHIHVVTVPQPGAPAGLLWERFAGVLGLDPAGFDTQVARSNTSLGVVECELLRRVNRGLRGRLAPQHYDPVIRVNLAGSVLAGLGGSRPLLPPRRYAWAVQHSARVVAGIRAAGYSVAGDLDELMPLPANAQEPVHVSDEDLLHSAVAAVAGLLVELEPMRERLDRRGEKTATAGGSTRRSAATIAKRLVHGSS